MTVFPLSVWLKTENWASSKSLALLTGIEKLSQSPADDVFLMMISFSFNQALTASTLSGFGAMNALA